ncbi:bacteriocin immunity protein [Lactobacillus acidophilus]|uniref:bacteriocin immunity protein n=1 Tax=Lactobacillus acidophilus TaxID=1579 RepID=UPI0013DE6957|nr:bacteriocin immunity protein [Lactobacillus acidophilus]
MVSSKEKLQQVLMNLQKECASDRDAGALIDNALDDLKHNVDLDKVIFRLNQNISNYSLAHDFKLTPALTKLQIMLRENPNKWTDAGLTGSI